MGTSDRLKGLESGFFSRSDGPESYKPSIYRDIFDHFFSESADNTEEIVSECIEAPGDKSPNVAVPETGEEKKLETGHVADAYKDALDNIADVLAVIRSGSPAEQYSKFRDQYLDILDEFSMNDPDLSFARGQLSKLRQYPENNWSMERGFGHAGKGGIEGHETSAKDTSAKNAGVNGPGAKDTNTKDTFVKNIDSFIRVYAATPQGIEWVFNKIGRVYDREGASDEGTAEDGTEEGFDAEKGMDAVMDFAEALYFPIKGRGLHLPVKQAYAGMIISMWEKGRTAEQANEFAGRVNAMADVYSNCIDKCIDMTKQIYSKKGADEAEDLVEAMTVPFEIDDHSSRMRVSRGMKDQYGSLMLSMLQQGKEPAQLKSFASNIAYLAGQYPDAQGEGAKLDDHSFADMVKKTQQGVTGVMYVKSSTETRPNEGGDE
ncbi:MAG: hypothetical protein R6U32_03735 [Candidatus Woesearchaeota archaeon]